MMYVSIAIFLLMVLLNLLFKIASFFRLSIPLLYALVSAYPFSGLGTGAGDAGNPYFYRAGCAGHSELGRYDSKEESCANGEKTKFLYSPIISRTTRSAILTAPTNTNKLNMSSPM